jgi:phytoene dehydrogenase-like protein
VHDAIVIGSGPNGLAAAIALARGGRSVLVLEAAERPGGAVATEELTLPGFRHDTFSAVYPAAAASPVFSRMPLERHGLRWVHPRWCMVQALPDGRAAVLSRDLGETAAALDALHPGDGERWAAFAAPFVKHAGALRRALLSGFPPVRGGLELVARAGLRHVLDLARVSMMPAEALADELFRSTGARAWLYGSARHGDVPPPAAGSAIMGVYLNLLGHAVGWPSPEGGAGRLTDALVGYLRELGGELRCNSPVERVLVTNGRVTGVEGFPARIVIADTTPHALLELTGDALEGRYAAALQRYRYGAATLKLDWALDAPIPWTAFEARETGTVHLGGVEEPFLLCGQQTIADPTRAPAGKHTAWAYRRAPAETGEVERIEAQIERYAPGFKDRILARHVLTPADMEARNRNLVRGDIGNGTLALDQLVFRPLPSLMPYRTPVRGLYLGSAAAFPGGAAHGVPGHAAATLALRLDSLRGGRLRARTPA